MPVFDENGKQITTDEEFPKMKDPEESNGTLYEQPKKKLPLVPIALGIVALIFLVVAVLYMIRAGSLEQEIEILKKSKAQLAIAETKLQEVQKENQKVRSDLSQAKSELDTVRAKNQALEDQLANARKKAAAAPKKEAKPAPKKKAPKKP